MNSTITFEPDGSGTMAVDVRVDLGMLQGFAESQESAGEMEAQILEDLRATTDTTPGLYLDTVFVEDRDDGRHMHGSVRFDSVEVLAAFGGLGDGGGMASSDMRVRKDGRGLRIAYITKPDSTGDGGEGSSSGR